MSEELIARAQLAERLHVSESTIGFQAWRGSARLGSAGRGVAWLGRGSAGQGLAGRGRAWQGEAGHGEATLSRRPIFETEV